MRAAIRRSFHDPAQDAMVAEAAIGRRKFTFLPAASLVLNLGVERSPNTPIFVDESMAHRSARLFGRTA